MSANALLSVQADPPLDVHEAPQARAIGRILEAFLEEALPEGGIAADRSPWQAPGRGSAAGSGMFPGAVDVRYLRSLVECLYRMEALTGDRRFRVTADAHVRYMARAMRPGHPTWAWGNALEMVGVYHCYNPRCADLVACVGGLVEWARQRSVAVTTVDGITFRHFPCGYPIARAKDAGWTNDLSMFGASLVWAYELTGAPSALEDAASFAEYFVQPWRPGALGEDGFWRCGTWREDLGSWVVGPEHFSGFESTDAYGDEVSWVYSTRTCIDFLTRLHRHRADDRYLDCCTRAAEWTFRECQFDDGAVGMCGRDDKWLGLTGDALSQVAQLEPLLAGRPDELRSLRNGAKRARHYLDSRLPVARIEDHGVDWVSRTTSLDPLVNVGMLWASALLGWLDARRLTEP